MQKVCVNVHYILNHLLAPCKLLLPVGLCSWESLQCHMGTKALLQAGVEGPPVNLPSSATLQTPLFQGKGEVWWYGWLIPVKMNPLAEPLSEQYRGADSLQRFLVTGAHIPVLLWLGPYRPVGKGGQPGFAAMRGEMRGRYGETRHGKTCW